MPASASQRLRNLEVHLQNVMAGHEALVPGELDLLEHHANAPAGWINALRVVAAGTHEDRQLPLLEGDELRDARDLLGFPSWEHVWLAAMTRCVTYGDLLDNKHASMACKLAYLRSLELAPQLALDLQLAAGGGGGGGGARGDPGS